MNLSVWVSASPSYLVVFYMDASDLATLPFHHGIFDVSGKCITVIYHICSQARFMTVSSEFTFKSITSDLVLI